MLTLLDLPTKDSPAQPLSEARPEILGKSIVPHRRKIMVRKEPKPAVQPEFQAVLSRQMQALPWWMISGAFHALLFLLTMLIGLTFLPEVSDKAWATTNFEKRKAVRGDFKRFQKPIPMVLKESKGTSRMSGVEFSAIVAYQEIEVSDFPDPAEAPGADDVLGIGGFGETAINDVVMGGSGTIGSFGLGEGSQGAFGRPTSKQGRLRRAIAGGGNKATESAVDRALAWLAENQEPDGHWDSRKHGASTPKWCDTSTSGFAVLAFLGAGHTEKVGKYKENVQRAVKWLIAQQRDDGALRPSSYNRNLGYANAIGGLALAEAAAMARIHVTELAAQKSLNYGATHQRGAGEEKKGYRYLPQQAGDLSNTGWYIMQLKSAKVAGLRMPRDVFEGVTRFLDHVESKNFIKRDEVFYDNGRHRYGYTHANQVTHRRTSMGCLARQFMGWEPNELRGGVEWFMAAGGVPSQGKVDLYYWYYGTICTFQQGEEIWRRWNVGLKDALLPTQNGDGSWNPTGAYAEHWGRVGQTALSALCLEVYYRYLPMYR